MMLEPEPTFSPAKVANSERLFDIKLSCDASKLLYHVKPQYKANDHETCAIWLADVDTPESARQFTSGLFNDTSACFHPDRRRLVFLSDRHEVGGSLQLYSMNLSGGEALPLFGTDNKKKVSGFSVSPDGRFVAFTSADELTDEEQKREKEKDDAMVFGDKKPFERLRLFTFSTKEVRTLNVRKDKHVYFFAWRPDSKGLVFISRSHVELEFTEEKTDLEEIPVAAGDFAPQRIGTYPRSPTDICPLSAGVIVDVQSFSPEVISDSKSVFWHPKNSFNNAKQLYGEDEDAFRVRDMGHHGLVAVEVAKGLHTRIDVLDEGNFVCTLYETTEDAISENAWDAKRREDGTNILVAIMSSAFKHEPPNVYVGMHKEQGILNFMKKVSSHHQWMKEVPKTKTEVFEWDGEDRTRLNGLVIFPPNSESDAASKQFPTILVIHGGPYLRDTPRYVPSSASWHYLLASQGYLILSPNYRGSSGRGSQFARAAQGGVGTVDWSDCASMLDAAIARGMADPAHLGIAGWSQGGFMSAWGVGATKNRFKAAVVGAGVSDWGQLAAESDLPDSEADLGGSAPWSTSDPGKRVDVLRSPIGNVEGVETAVLILHGEKDKRVPVSQGISFFRGLRRKAKYPERAQLVIYPREGHMFTEKKHSEDMMQRVIEHFEHWL